MIGNINQAGQVDKNCIPRHQNEIISVSAALKRYKAAVENLVRVPSAHSDAAV